MLLNFAIQHFHPQSHLSSPMREFSCVFVFAYTFEGFFLEKMKVMRIFQSIAQWERAPNEHTGGLRLDPKQHKNNRSPPFSTRFG